MKDTHTGVGRTDRDWNPGRDRVLLPPLKILRKGTRPSQTLNAFNVFDV